MGGDTRDDDLAVAHRRLRERRIHLASQIRAAQQQLGRIDRQLEEIEQSLPPEHTIEVRTGARAPGHTGGRKPKLDPRQVTLARQMYDEKDKRGKRRYTVAQIATMLGVTPPTIYRHLRKTR
jgi:DNA invertase Pin-like site-specific DNA recombinase